MELSGGPESLFESLAGLRSLADSGRAHPTAKVQRAVGGLGQVASGGDGSSSSSSIHTPFCPIGMPELLQFSYKGNRAL